MLYNTDSRFVCSELKYYDGMYTTDRTVLSNIASGRTRCHDYSCYFLWMCKKAGLECRNVYGNTLPGLHVWNKVRLGKRWYSIDLTWIDTAKKEKTKRKYELTKGGWTDHTAASELEYPLCQ